MGGWVVLCIFGVVDGMAWRAESLQLWKVYHVARWPVSFPIQFSTVQGLG